MQCQSMHAIIGNVNNVHHQMIAASRYLGLINWQHVDNADVSTMTVAILKILTMIVAIFKIRPGLWAYREWSKFSILMYRRGVVNDPLFLKGGDCN